MASLARSVQMRSVPDVQQAYNNWSIPAFALYQNKQLLFAYDDEGATVEEGEQFLTQWLQTLERSGSAAIYTLAVYKDFKKGITSATPYSGSVNFQLSEYSYGGGGGGAMVRGISDPGQKIIMDQLAAMQLQIQKLQQVESEEEEEEEDELDRTLGKITNLLSNPIVAGLLGSLLPTAAKQITQPTHMQPLQSEPGTVSRIAGPNDADQALADALTNLQGKVTDLPGLLQQLCKFADKKPLQFKLYMATLMKMKL